MPRLILGGVLGGLAMWFVGFLFWGTPLSLIALSSTDGPTTAALQGALSQHLGPLGTGAYPIPWPGTAQGTGLYGQGPTAMVFFNTLGFANPDTSALVAGLVLAVICSLLVALALRLSGVTTFGGRLKLVALVAFAVTAYSNLGQPIFNHMPWRYFIYLWVSDVASWVAAGAVIAWFLTRTATEAPAAPAS
jgi:hypothetical protein